MFKVGDKVSFGIRYGNGVRKGGIVRLNGKIVNIKDSKISVQTRDKEYTLRELKGGWVEQSERDDPKGRLYLKLLVPVELWEAAE